MCKSVEEPIHTLCVRCAAFGIGITNKAEDLTCDGRGVREGGRGGRGGRDRQAGIVEAGL